MGIEVVDAKLVLEQARVIKSPEELKCMKAAIEVCEIGINKMREELKAGITEDELWSILHKTNIENGGEWIECRILSSGERTNPWMQESSNKIIQSGEIVSFDTDMVGPYGYCADISRAFVEGHQFNEEQKKDFLETQKEYQSNLNSEGYGLITTEIKDVGPFYYAEHYHQQYLAKNPDGYCGVDGTGVELT